MVRRLQPDAGGDLVLQGDRDGTGRLRLTRLSSVGRDGRSASLVCGEPGSIELHYEAVDVSRNVQISVGFFTTTGEGALIVGNEFSGDELACIPRQGVLRCKFAKVPLLPGTYSLNLFVSVSGEIADWLRDAARLSVEDGDFFGTGKLPPSGYGSIAVDHRWEVADQ